MEKRANGKGSEEGNGEKARWLELKEGPEWSVMKKWQGLVKHSVLAQGLRMTTATRQEVLGLYRRIFRLARKWQAASGQMEDTIKEKQYILNEARTLFQKNKNLTDADLIKQCIDECTARIEIGLHYQIPYPRPIHLPPMGLTPLQGRGLRSQEKLRKLSKPVYLKSHDEIS
ncbi:LYR motif-containing protein 1 isoform X2 [Zalophus californianus]|uniref:LYR motif-containing protein 1 isoform X5 n=2 Tax=Otariidae TaxID=9702 RepID=A0A3Q7MTI3_CALUR|nr:LYR motif-containing protein 1 isoform X5 [Callorhinus ursinus]XP_027467978.1 LYR motif-containing protein 1 isoform X2 [Zalophus californianus]